MLIFIAAGVALPVIAHNKVREKDPELASAAMHRVHQLAAVVVGLTTFIDKAVEASASGSKPRPQFASAYGVRRSWQHPRRLGPGAVMTTSRHLKSVPRTRGQQVLDYRCDLITQAVLGGDVDFRVQAMSPIVGPGPGTISIRLGRFVLVIANRDALEVLTLACGQGLRLADRAFGPEPPAPSYKPR